MTNQISEQLSGEMSPIKKKNISNHSNISQSFLSILGNTNDQKSLFDNNKSNDKNINDILVSIKKLVNKKLGNDNSSENDKSSDVISKLNQNNKSIDFKNKELQKQNKIVNNLPAEKNPSADKKDKTVVSNSQTKEIDQLYTEIRRKILTYRNNIKNLNDFSDKLEQFENPLSFLKQTKNDKSSDVISKLNQNNKSIDFKNKELQKQNKIVNNLPAEKNPSADKKDKTVVSNSQTKEIDQLYTEIRRKILTYRNNIKNLNDFSDKLEQLENPLSFLKQTNKIKTDTNSSKSQNVDKDELFSEIRKQVNKFRKNIENLKSISENIENIEDPLAEFMFSDDIKSEILKTNNSEENNVLSSSIINSLNKTIENSETKNQSLNEDVKTLESSIVKSIGNNDIADNKTKIKFIKEDSHLAGYLKSNFNFTSDEIQKIQINEKPVNNSNEINTIKSFELIFKSGLGEKISAETEKKIEFLQNFSNVQIKIVKVQENSNIQTEQIIEKSIINNKKQLDNKKEINSEIKNNREVNNDTLRKITTNLTNEQNKNSDFDDEFKQSSKNFSTSDKIQTTINSSDKTVKDTPKTMTFNNVRPEEITKTFTKLINNNQANPVINARLNLYPKSLGRVFVEINMNDKNVKINIKADTGETVKILENQISSLKEGLKQQGLQADLVNIKMNEEESFREDIFNRNQREDRKNSEGRREFSDSFKDDRSEQQSGEVKNQNTVRKVIYKQGSYIEQYI